jgi:hypothetical protein
MAGHKSYFFNSQIKVVRVPRLQELSAKNVYRMAMGHPEISKFLPDHNDEGMLAKLGSEFLFPVSC